ncbi:MAG: polysaccharide deacetylase family protein [Lachnospiraceae bacterium]|nr:polysaccharide deacetylase family protein [Lachnospiraceae bacterium]
MKKLLFLVLSFSLLLCSTVFGATTKVPILMYHGVEKESTGTWVVSEKQFNADMEFLSRNFYTPLVAEDLIKIKKGELQMPERPVMITFDDGYENNYTVAFPILKKNDMKATIAVIGRLIRDENGSGRAGYLHWTQLKEMYDSGLVDIGSHTYNLHDLDAEGFYTGTNNGIRQLEGEVVSNYLKRTGDDLRKSISDIEGNVGNDVLYFAYPFGKTNGYFNSVLGNYGIRVSVSTNTGTANIANGLNCMPRYTITPEQWVCKILPAISEEKKAEEAKKLGVKADDTIFKQN